MPYRIVPFKNGYRLQLLSNPQHIFSYKPMKYEDVVKQMQAIEIRKRGGFCPYCGGISKEEIMKQKPSAYRSMLLSKYGYTKNKKNNDRLATWRAEKWVNLNALLDKNQILPCGKKYKGQTDATVCRPLVYIDEKTPKPLAKELTKSQLRKAIKMKNQGLRINWSKL